MEHTSSPSEPHHTTPQSHPPTSDFSSPSSLEPKDFIEPQTTIAQCPPSSIKPLTFFQKYPPLPKAHILLNPSTSVRRHTILFATICVLISIIFTILVLVGNTYNIPVINNIYFLRLDLSHLIPDSVPDNGRINSIAQSLGLSDFYQVGIWGYCEGLNDEGVTYCTKPKHWYWFDPVEIIEGQLFQGATIVLPADISNALNLARTASYWMFVFFIIGIVFNFISVLTGWISIYSRRAAGICGTIQGVGTLGTTLGAMMATTIYSLFRSVFEKAPEVTVMGILGREMFVYMWMAAGFSIAALVLHSTLCCCGRMEKRRREIERRSTLTLRRRRLRFRRYRYRYSQQNRRQ
ncbi:SUR7/PalI family-domain-containing protein [Peziza echinospora]|nr:SUR7/PalI family-domain-containing protein [Peziza echinospora]